MIRSLLREFWSILEPVVINVDMPPEACLRMLDNGARPSIERLHMRETFVEGRRYFMEATSDGFRMVTTSKTFFNRRRRTDALCVVTATVAPSGEGKTSIAVRARTRPIAYFYAFWVPLAMVYLLISVPWPKILTFGLLALIFVLAWASLRYGAALEANEMVFFIQKTFEDVPKFSLGVLAPSADNIVGGREFDLMWEKFVRTHQGDS